MTNRASSVLPSQSWGIVQDSQQRYQDAVNASHQRVYNAIDGLIKKGMDFSKEVGFAIPKNELCLSDQEFASFRQNIWDLFELQVRLEEFYPEFRESFESFSSEPYPHDERANPETHFRLCLKKLAPVAVAVLPPPSMEDRMGYSSIG